MFFVNIIIFSSVDDKVIDKGTLVEDIGKPINDWIAIEMDTILFNEIFTLD